jgi:hypothetical protein
MHDMSGSRAKKLRKEAWAHGLTRNGYRTLKREWAGTPRPEKAAFSVADVAVRLKQGDMRKLETRLKSAPREVLERLYRRVTGRK